MTEPIWSTGGTGGERAVTEDLEWAVGVLRAAADDVDAARLELLRRRAAMQLDSGTGLSPGVGHAAAMAELAYAAHTRTPALQAELEDVAARLNAVAHAYIDAERRARHGVGVLERVRQEAQDEVGRVAWLARVAGAGLLVATPIGALLMETGHSDVISDVLPDGSPPTTALADRDAVEAFARMPTMAQWEAALGLVLFMLEHLALEPWVGRVTGTRVTVPSTGSLEDSMHRLRQTELAGGGAVRIERWTDEGGVIRRIVYLPGTEDWGFWSANPSDLDADVWLMLGALPNAAHVVEAALEADGAKPGEPVMLAGHSLGGIVATALASNPEFRRRFDVKAVLTAGSPTGRIALPPSVRALHLEGTRDIVPGLDGRPNPDTPTRVTVHHDARDSQAEQLEGEGESIGSAHSLDTYAQTARLVDEGLSPSTDAWLEAEGDFFAPGHDAVVTEYRPGDGGSS